MLTEHSERLLCVCVSVCPGLICTNQIQINHLKQKEKQRIDIPKS